MDVTLGDTSDPNGSGLKLWNSVLGAALKIPGARIERASFLRSALNAHASAELVEEAVASTPAKAGIPSDSIRRAALSSIKWHRAGVSSVSLLAGLPGGPWLVGTIPADFAQYFWHMIVLLQKLSYLHGWPELFQKDEEVDDETKLLLTLFIGVMLGAHGASDGLGKIATALAAQFSKRLPRAPLTKYAVYQVAKQVARWLGVSLTKRKFAELVGRVVPIIGGLFAGAVTWTLFGAGAKRLHVHLEGLALAREG
jgi:hypothetical protein